MKYLLFVLVLLCPAICEAQGNTHLRIGLWDVGPEYDLAQHRLFPVRGFIDIDTSQARASLKDSVRFHYLTQTQFTRARELGSNLISVLVDPNQVRRDANPNNRNVAADICHNAIDGADTLEVCLRDWEIENHLMAERLMFHPEAASDFSSRGDYALAEQDGFNGLPILGMNLSTPLEGVGSGNNVIVMRPGDGTVSSLTEDRKRELSVFRTLTDGSDKAVSGLYLISVTVQDDNLPLTTNPPNTSETVLNVEIISKDPSNPDNTHTLVYPLPGSSFYEGGTLRSDPFETVLGSIEVIHENVTGSDTILYVQDDSQHSNPAWSDTTLFFTGKLSISDDGFDEMDIRVSYGTTSAQFYLDAVCLTNPATYSLYYPTSAEAVPAHQWRRSNLETRLAGLVLDENSPPAVYPNLRFLGGMEQKRSSGMWASGYLAEKLLDSISSSQVSFFVPNGASWDTDFPATINTRLNSGFYYYPIDTLAQRPTLDGTNPAEYYQYLNRPEIRGFTEMSRVYRSLQEKRKLLSVEYSWLPFIQNHSNVYENYDYDNDPLREPTAAEFRHQCNISLAHSAEGMFFYSFISGPGETSNPYWPTDINEWESDTTGGNPRYLDPRMGTLSFLQENLGKRHCDWNGENKWDSAATYIGTFLKPIGDFMKRHLVWERSKEWNLQWEPGDTGTNDFVSGVLSMRQDSPSPIDPGNETYVFVSEFTESSTNYLFVLNDRTHPTEGHRHITVKLTGDPGDETQWKVTKILGEDEEGDIWIVRANAYPDTTTTANGFTDYFEPGSAALYRLDPVINESVDFQGECLGGNVFIEPAATLRTGSDAELKFALGNGLVCDGALYANQTLFTQCDVEQTWEGIVARNGGTVQLKGVTISGGPVVSGSGGSVTLTHTSSITASSIALINYGGELSSTSTISSGVVRHLSSVGNGKTRLKSDSSTGDGSTYSTAIFNAFNCDSVTVEESIFTQFWRGVFALDSWVEADSDFKVSADSGNNSFRVDTIGLEAQSDGEILFGDIRWNPSPASLNEIILSNTQGYHAIASDSSIIYARQNWWEPGGSLNVTGSVLTDYPFYRDPVPFQSDGRQFLLSKNTSGSVSQPSFSAEIRDSLALALRQQRNHDVRAIVGRFMQAQHFNSSPYHLLRYVYRALNSVQASGAIDTLFGLCMKHPSIEWKLLAADIAAEDSLFTEALSILNSYSFAGSTDLLQRSLLRKTILYPLAQSGGYQQGLQALDSLRQQLTPNNPLWNYCDMYPILFSRLRHRVHPAVPKRQIQTIIERTIPEGIELGQNYPNPFRDVTSFTFKLGEATRVRLTVYDAMGREVAIVTDAYFDRGVHSAILQSAHLPIGLYFYRFMTEKGVIQRKMMLVR